MARKFSLKDNPIFQRLEAPEPRKAEPPADKALPSDEAFRSSDRQMPSDKGHDMTVSLRPSDFDPQILTLSHTPAHQAHAPADSPQAQGAPSRPTSRDQGLKDHLDKSLFFSFFNEMVDSLLPTLDPNEQVLYIRLFRLSYGFNRNYCTVSQSLLIERTGFSRNTIRTSLQSLVHKGWIRVAEAGNRVSTTYRVVLPRETRIESSSDRAIPDPQNLTLTTRPRETDGHEMTRTIRGSEDDPPEGQISALQNLTRTKRPAEPPENIDTSARGSDFEGQGLPPLLKAFTHNSLTLQMRERGSHSEGQNLPLSFLTLSTRELVDKFYSRLGQRPSKAKREKSVEECLSLLLEGFTVEEVDYAIDWLVQQHPATGSFSRLSHFIDQAVKDREARQRTRELEQQQDHEAERQRAERQRLEEERQRIEEVKVSLPRSVIEELYREAADLVEQENPNLKLGKDLITRMKFNELIKLRYLS